MTIDVSSPAEHHVSATEFDTVRGESGSAVRTAWLPCSCSLSWSNGSDLRETCRRPPLYQHFRLMSDISASSTCSLFKWLPCCQGGVSTTSRTRYALYICLALDILLPKTPSQYKVSQIGKSTSNTNRCDHVPILILVLVSRSLLFL